MKRKSDKPWFWGYTFAALRRVARWNPALRVCIKEANGICAICHKPVEKLQGDHIEPVVPVTSGFDGDWTGYVNRLMLGKLQALCLPCHKSKSKGENALRRKRGKSNE